MWHGTHRAPAPRDGTAHISLKLSQHNGTAGTDKLYHRRWAEKARDQMRGAKELGNKE